MEYNPTYGRFSLLPRELRDMIWLYLMPWNQEPNLPYGEYSMCRASTPSVLTALCLSRGINAELMHFLYKDWKFVFIVRQGQVTTNLVHRFRRFPPYRARNLLEVLPTVRSCFRGIQYSRFFGVEVRLYPLDSYFRYRCLGQRENLSLGYKAVRLIIECLTRAPKELGKPKVTVTFCSWSKPWGLNHGWFYSYPPLEESHAKFRLNDLTPYVETRALDNPLTRLGGDGSSGGVNDVFFILGPFGLLNTRITVYMPPSVFESSFTGTLKTKGKEIGEGGNRMMSIILDPAQQINTQDRIQRQVATSKLYFTVLWDTEQDKRVRCMWDQEELLNDVRFSADLERHLIEQGL